MNRFLLISAFLLITTIAAYAQQAGVLEPVYEIPSTIARPAAAMDFEGDWRRMDRQYELILSDMDSPEGPKALYNNPSPVNVQSATLLEEENNLVLKVVLMDEGYPGSTYVLQFLPERQILFGTYNRPGSEPANVYFLREEDIQ